MEEDLEVLEKELANIRNLIEYYTFESLDYDKKFRMERFEKAIKNLIKEYKELIKENIELNDKLQMTKNSVVIGNLNIVEDYIPKSKVREVLDTKYIAMFEGDTEFPDDATIMKTVKYVKVSDIEELLQEGDDK